MNEIEQRLRDAFDADAQTVGPGSLRPPPGPALPQAAGGGLRRGGLLMPLAAAASVAAVILGVAVVPSVWPGRNSGQVGHHRRYLPILGPTGSFLAVTTSPAVIHGGRLFKYEVSALELRSVRHGGRAISTLLRSLGRIDAVVAPGGAVIAVVDHGCRSQVFRIDPGTGRRRLIRTLPESAGAVALSPDGRRLAYLTYPASDPQPCGPARQPASPVRVHVHNGGYVHFLPSVLAVVGLASGAVVRAPSGAPGSPPWSPAWSPDGTAIAVVRSGAVQLLSASHPDFATARRLPPPRGCGYLTSTWTVSGILAVLGCGKQAPGLSPRTLVRLSAGGRRTHAWRLPACIGGIGLFADPTAAHVLVQADIGYGNGPACGLHRPGGWTSRVAVVRGATLGTIAVFSQRAGWPQVTGW
jgi:hypothetical protein